MNVEGRIECSSKNESCAIQSGVDVVNFWFIRSHRSVRGCDAGPYSRNETTTSSYSDMKDYRLTSIPARALIGDAPCSRFGRLRSRGWQVAGHYSNRASGLCRSLESLWLWSDQVACNGCGRQFQAEEVFVWWCIQARPATVWGCHVVTPQYVSRAAQTRLTDRCWEIGHGYRRPLRV